MSEDGKIISLYDKRMVCCINCPDCDYDQWLILVDQVSDFNHYTGFKCANPDCSFHVEFDLHRDILENSGNKPDQGSTKGENPTDQSKKED